MLRLSQGHLNLLEICPPKFKQSYLDRASSLPNPEIEDRQAWGSRFHLLMQQRELGLPIESLLQEDTELDRSLKALVQAAPELLNPNHHEKRAAEHSRTIGFGNYLLTVIYDLLIARRDRATIIDWKTYLKPQTKNKLARNWQTRLYLYVLAETSAYSPEQLSMTYWFVGKFDKPVSHTFFYNKQLHHKTQQDLTTLLTELDSWLKPDCLDSFLHRNDCDNCPYASELLTTNIGNEDNYLGDRDCLQKEISKILEIEI